MKITLKAARHNAGYTQQEAADLLGVTPLTILNWEKGKYLPRPRRRRVLAQVYEIPVENIKWEKD